VALPVDAVTLALLHCTSAVRWLCVMQAECGICGMPIEGLTPELNPSAQRCLKRIFYWGFSFLNRAFRKYMREKPTNAPIIHSVY
jgi:hypothetical protein